VLFAVLQRRDRVDERHAAKLARGLGRKLSGGEIVGEHAQPIDRYRPEIGDAVEDLQDPPPSLRIVPPPRKRQDFVPFAGKPSAQVRAEESRGTANRYTPQHVRPFLSPSPPAVRRVSRRVMGEKGGTIYHECRPPINQKRADLPVRAPVSPFAPPQKGS
jgi:hypothetical protein